MVFWMDNHRVTAGQFFNTYVRSEIRKKMVSLFFLPCITCVQVTTCMFQPLRTYERDRNLSIQRATYGVKRVQFHTTHEKNLTANIFMIYFQINLVKIAIGDDSRLKEMMDPLPCPMIASRRIEAINYYTISYSGRNDLIRSE